MSSNLTVKTGTSVVLDENPSPLLTANFERRQITTLDDLVKFGLIESNDTINKLLDAAKAVTTSTLGNSSTFTPNVTIPGTSRPNLRRFGSFIAAVPNININKVTTFWRVARTIDPQILTNVTSKTILADLGSRVAILPTFFFADVTIEESGTLIINAPIGHLKCNNLLIKKNGRILINSSGLMIKASSIKGN